MKQVVTKAAIVAVALTGVMLFTGCASITQGTTDTVQVGIGNCVEQIPCTATNKKGSWEFTAPGPVRFKKSDDTLIITCEDHTETVTFEVIPVRGGMAWGNVVFGGIIGGGIDSATDAHWKTADSITLARKYCNGQPIN